MANRFGDMYDNVLTGTPDADVLWGGMGDDQLSGGAGDDRLIGGPGADALDGGPGMDIASYTDSTRGVHVDLGTSFSSGDDDAPVRGGDAEGDSLTGIESIWGSNFADMLIGSHAANYLFGNGGNDRLEGGRGNDLLRGGMDDDVLMGEDGADTLYGDAGIDDLMGGAGNDLLRGGYGDDLLSGGMGSDVLEGGMGADELDGGEDDDGMDVDIASYAMSSEAVTVNLSVAPGAATADNPHAAGGEATGDVLMNIEGIRGSMHADMLTGDMYANTLFGNMGADKIKGMGGDDTVHGGKGNDTIYGGAGDDMLMGEMGDDAIKGEAGDDTLVGGPGADKLFGGEFDPETMMPGDDMHGEMDMGDTADYSMSDAGVTIDLSDTSRSQPNPIGEGGHAEGDELVDIENLKGSMYDDMLTGTDADGNRLYGMDGDDMLSGKDGDDMLDGGKGMDTLNGGAGADTLVGGDGDDTFVYRTVNDATAETDDASTTRVTGAPDAPTDGSLDLYQIDETRYRVTDLADDQANGDPMVSGGGGMDTIDASGATGDVTIDLNVMRLVAAPMASVAADTTADPPVEGRDAQPLQEAPIYSSIEMVIGGEFDDTITGNVDAATHLMGGEGNDTLTGGTKDDTLDGEAGNDVVTGGMGNDTLMGGSGDDVIGRINEGDPTSDPTDTDPDEAGADMLMGGSGDDTLRGGSGDDTLMGGSSTETGSNTLTGGAGADTFVYGGGTDNITDFTISRAGSDKIDLSSLELTEAEFAAILAGAEVAGGNTYLRVNANDDGSFTAGDQAGEYDIVLTGYGDGTEILAASDFIIE